MILVSQFRKTFPAFHLCYLTLPKISMVAAASSVRLLITAVSLWLAGLFYASTILFYASKNPNVSPEPKDIRKNSDNDEMMKIVEEGKASATVHRRLTLAMIEIQEIRKKNEKLQAAISSKNGMRGQENGTQGAESTEQSDTQEEESTQQSDTEEAESTQQNDTQQTESIQKLIEELTDQHRTILADAMKLSSAAGDETERRRILSNMTEITQNRLRHLQNPFNCSNPRKLVCQLNKGCGFGCQLHHVTYCLIVAYGTRRAMILDSSNWQYSQRGWDSIFLPASQTCNYTDNVEELREGDEIQTDANTIKLPIIDYLWSRPPYLPLSFPEEFADRLLAVHGYPPVWWVGQFVWYLMRYQPHFQQEIDSMSSRLNFTTPCVGVHVRRTDKIGTEAARHELEEYMAFVEAWYRVEAIKNETAFNAIVKRVYLATDEPGLFAEAREKYPQYTFIGDKAVAKSAQLSSRYTDSSLRGVVADIHFLSRCDYLVCTFSSQVCRTAYELMQVAQGDAASHAHSLDDVYYFGGQEPHEQVAIHPHQATTPSEIDLEVGDVVGIAGNHWDGYSKGTNKRTGKMGLYPSYKVKEKWRIVKFPDYSDVDAGHF